MEQFSQASGVLMVVCIILTLLALLLAIHLFLRIKKLEKRMRRFMKGKDGVSLEKEFAREFAKLDQLTKNQTVLRADVEQLKLLEKGDFSKYGIVKYDAFDDVGGKMSFALALLNEQDTGIVLNAIHSKDNCFLYMKEIVNGESYVILSEEERKALQNAKREEETTINIMSTKGGEKV